MRCFPNDENKLLKQELDKKLFLDKQLWKSPKARSEDPRQTHGQTSPRGRQLRGSPKCRGDRALKQSLASEAHPRIGRLADVGALTGFELESTSGLGEEVDLEDILRKKNGLTLTLLGEKKRKSSSETRAEV